MLQTIHRPRGDSCHQTTSGHAHSLIPQVDRRETVRRIDAGPAEMEFEESGIGEECGVFGCVAAGEWPTHLEVAQILTLGLVALQHRQVSFAERCVFVTLEPIKSQNERG